MSSNKLRKIVIGKYLIDNPKESITDISKKFKISRSQVWKDIDDLKNINIYMYERCLNIFKEHKKWSYIRLKRRKK